MMQLTPEIIHTCHMRRGAHMDGRDRDGGWFADMAQIVEHPRLQRMEKIWRKRSKQAEINWWVDGENLGSLENALAYLNSHPLPAISITERAVLEYISDEWMALPGTPEHVRTLADKGLIEFEKHGASRLRRTELAGQLLAEED